jgi:hypothetical protein
MAGEPILPRTAAWVWHSGPRSIFGLDAVFVRCCSGDAATARDGFDFADNYRAWAAARGPAVVPWAWFGPPASADGPACAEALCTIAPDQPLYVVEVGAGLRPGQVAAFAARMRDLAPAADLGFSTLPTRAEAEAAGVPWDACVDAFDLGLPQVYTPLQRPLLLGEDPPVVADMGGKPVHVAVFPDADPGWLDSARAGVTEHAGASAWAVDQSSFASWRRQLAALAEERPEPRPGRELPARPAGGESLTPVPAAEPAAAAPPEPGVRSGLHPLRFVEPGEEALLAHRILARVQARLDAGGKLTDDELVTDIEAVLRDAAREAGGH